LVDLIIKVECIVYLETVEFSDLFVVDFIFEELFDLVFGTDETGLVALIDLVFSEYHSI